MANAFLGELFDRNARWILKDSPYMGCLAHTRESSAYIIDQAFSSTVVSRRLVMFQVYFLQNIGRMNNKGIKIFSSFVVIEECSFFSYLLTKKVGEMSSRSTTVPWAGPRTL